MGRVGTPSKEKVSTGFVREGQGFLWDCEVGTSPLQGRGAELGLSQTLNEHWSPYTTFTVVD